MKREFFTAALLLFIASTASIWLFLYTSRQKPLDAAIFLDGICIKKIDLNSVNGRMIFDVRGEGVNTIEAEYGRIRIVSADCPKKICVLQGWISSSALPIVCLPNKVVIKIQTRDFKSNAVLQ